MARAWCCSCLHEEDDRSSQLVYDPNISPEGPDDWSEVSCSRPPRPPSVAVAKMSGIEKAQEKARLQELVKDFARRAVHGIECQLVAMKTGQVSPAMYYVDKRLRTLRITPDDPARQEICGDL